MKQVASFLWIKMKTKKNLKSEIKTENTANIQQVRQKMTKYDVNK